MFRRRLLCPIRTGWLVLASLVGLLIMSAPAAAQTGTVSGTVTNADTGAPIAGQLVLAWRQWVATSTVASAFTDASGVYSIAVPPGALYYVVTNTFTGRLAGGVSGRPLFCRSAAATELREAEPFSVAAGGSVTGRDFGAGRSGVRFRDRHQRGRRWRRQRQRHGLGATREPDVRLLGQHRTRLATTPSSD